MIRLYDPTRTRIRAATLLAIALSFASSTAAQDGTSAATSTVAPELFGGLSFRSVGPSRGGRVTAVEGHRSHPHAF